MWIRPADLPPMWQLASLALLAALLLPTAPASSPRPESATIYQFLGAEGQPGESVLLRLAADTLPPGEGEQPPSVYAVEGLLHFDPEALAFVGFAVVPPSLSWEVGQEFLQEGSWGIHATDPELPALPGSAPMPDLDGGALLELEFEILVPGTHGVSLQLREIIPATPAQDDPCCIVHSVGTVQGTVEAGAVAGEALSLGRWKALPQTPARSPDR